MSCSTRRKKVIAIPKNRRWKAFFEAYKELPILWNLELDSDKIKKEIAYNDLLRVYRRIDKQANVHTLKDRLHKIKTVYLRELKKVLQSIRKVGGTHAMYVPNLWYFHQLDFLHNVYSKNFMVPSFAVAKNDDYSDEDTSSSDEGVSNVKCQKLERAFLIN